MPLEIRGAHFFIRSAQLVRENTLRIGTGGDGGQMGVIFGVEKSAGRLLYALSPLSVLGWGNGAKKT